MKIQRERLLEIIKEEIDWARQATTQVEEQEVSPWQKLAGMLQEEEGGVSQKVNSMLSSILQKVRSADYNETLIEVEEVLTRVIRLISKSGGALQEAGSPQLSLPKDLVFEIIEYLQDMSGLKMKGGDFVAKRARELLAKMDTGDTGPGALQEGKNIK